VTPRIVSIQIGLPRTYGRTDATDPHDKLWTTAFLKQPVAGPMQLQRTHIDGDACADRENHGGSDKAVLAYSADHYPFWTTELSLAEMPCGGFGENLTIAGSDEWQVCIGDTWQAGDVLFEVSQPRQPCWKLARRWRTADLAQRVVANGKSGWYLRVLAPGTLAADCEIALRSRPHPEWTVARAADVMYDHQHDRALSAQLAALPQLAESWRATLLRRIEKATP
jgi:MOSC domain-containing protein YiiM